ncbi:hypothetical protein CBR_g11124 [Chara braunii]|uniref:Sugar phosphate transporter domain-containing protein n=1 Tax=Chara braunii TaxID=69332 RepID=A0A388KQ50_CHABU|nr:hypothetical protein CBR_g11124 [Chara braunii]|eukprot:GBG72191.1 hypothetical protein CBR_g11124 [Chara braunii]
MSSAVSTAKVSSQRAEHGTATRKGSSCCVGRLLNLRHQSPSPSQSAVCAGRLLLSPSREATCARRNDLSAVLSGYSLTGALLSPKSNGLGRSLYLSGQEILPRGLGPVSLSRPKKHEGGGRTIVCKAYDAAGAGSVPDSSSAAAAAATSPSTAADSTKAGAGPVRLAIIFGLWYFFNVVFNIYNKKVLNVYPFPWLTSTLSLVAGTLFMLVSWAIRAQPAPRLSKEFLWALAPVALFHTIGHVAATVSMSKVAVSFTHIIKSSEPVFSVFVSSLFLGESFSLPVYLSLLPIVLGCSIAAVTELTFNAVGFWGAMISNVSFVFRNVFSKKGLINFKEIDGINLYAMITIVSLVYLTPLALFVEGPAAWTAGWNSATAQIGVQQLAWWMFLQSIFYHLYNQVSYMALDNISPLTFSVGNTMKRVVVIVAAIIVFKTKVTPLNAIGSAVAIFGTFLYSQAKAYSDKKQK